MPLSHSHRFEEGFDTAETEAVMEALGDESVPTPYIKILHTWAFRKQEEKNIAERSIERMMLGMSRFTKAKERIRSSLLRQLSKIRDAAAYAKEGKIRWAGHVMSFNETRAVSDWIPRDTAGRPPTRWSDLFRKSFKEKYDALRVSREESHWVTLVRDWNTCKYYWYALEQIDKQREHM
ncbi:hypothetical protein RB195_002215 [Necator americanus]|uniref:Uncharacterized protein n=1 Tax=Necator americanus TaxID=51031 RepID=A0ABR1DJH2_NECAM